MKSESINCCKHCQYKIPDILNVETQSPSPTKNIWSFHGIGVKWKPREPIEVQSLARLVEYCELSYPLRSCCRCGCHKSVIDSFWQRFWVGQSIWLKEENFDDSDDFQLSFFLILQRIFKGRFSDLDIWSEGPVEVFDTQGQKRIIMIEHQGAELYALERSSIPE